MTLLRAEDLVKYYRSGGVKAVDGVSLEIRERETVGLVGESGSGKSTLAKLLMRLVEPDAGTVSFEGGKFHKTAQMIFQEPHLSLDPRMTVSQTLFEALGVAGVRGRAECGRKTAQLLSMVELPASAAVRYPRFLSGGECQRVAIARALAVGPRLIICDEAVSSLDVIIRAQILNLLLKLQRETGLSYLFISHDHRVVRHMSDRILTMKNGKIEA